MHTSFLYVENLGSVTLKTRDNERQNTLRVDYLKENSHTTVTLIYYKYFIQLHGNVVFRSTIMTESGDSFR